MRYCRNEECCESPDESFQVALQIKPKIWVFLCNNVFWHFFRGWGGGYNWRQSCDKSTVKLSTTVAFCNMSTVDMLDCRLDSKSLIFFVKKSYLGPRWWHFRNFWPSWSWPIILSYHDSFGSHFHPLHVPIWPNESKTSIWACPDFWYLYK